jgi:nitrite reductase/ring-hydroxylating ferredoxin subunit
MRSQASKGENDQCKGYSVRAVSIKRLQVPKHGPRDTDVALIFCPLALGRSPSLLLPVLPMFAQAPAIAGLASARTSTLRKAPAASSLKMRFVPILGEDEVEEGKSVVSNSRNMKVVVTKKEGKTYAFNNKCPHLGLSLKRGKITGSDDRHGVCVVCPYHKSKFSLEDGKCKVWSESVLGIKGTEAIGEKIGGFIAPMAKSVNPEGKKAAPAQVFKTKVEDGQILVDLPPDLSRYAKTRKFIDYGVCRPSCSSVYWVYVCARVSSPTSLFPFALGVHSHTLVSSLVSSNVSCLPSFSLPLLGWSGAKAP